jgi:hypothetical protein
MLRVSAVSVVSWHRPGPLCIGPLLGPQQHGTADTIDNAKAQLEQQWRVWLRAVELVIRRAILTP